MKTYLTAASVAFFVSVLLAASVATGGLATPRPSVTFTLAGESLITSDPVQSETAPDYWLETLEVSAFNDVVVAVPQTDLAAVSAELVVGKGISFVSGGPFAIEAYSSAASVSSGTIPSVAAIGTLESLGSYLLRYRFFEFTGTHYVEHPAFTLVLEGPYTTVQSSLMHFAAISNGQQLPDVSTRYVFASTSNSGMSSDFWQLPLDHRLTLAVLQNAPYSAGAKALGQFTDELFEAILATPPTASERHCGGSKKCPVSNREDCTGFPQYDCYGPEINPGGCAVTNLEVVSSGATIPNYSLFWAFRDDFLLNSQRGVEYKNYYYTFSHFAKINLTSLALYANFLPLAEDAVDVLLNGADTDVVITEELYECAIDILDYHADVEDVAFQSILEAVREDLAVTLEMTKSQFVAALGE